MWGSGRWGGELKGPIIAEALMAASCDSAGDGLPDGVGFGPGAASTPNGAAVLAGAVEEGGHVVHVWKQRAETGKVLSAGLCPSTPTTPTHPASKLPIGKDIHPSLLHPQVIPNTQPLAAQPQCLPARPPIHPSFYQTRTHPDLQLTDHRAITLPSMHLAQQPTL